MIENMPQGELCIYDFWTDKFSGEVQILSQLNDEFHFQMINETEGDFMAAIVSNKQYGFNDS